MENRIWLKKAVIYFILLILTVTISNYIIDPYQIYHKHKFGFLPNERYQVPGIIQNYLYNKNSNIDSIIVGTSMSQNFIPQNRTLKLTISGSTPIIKDEIIKYSIKSNKIKNILLEIFESYTETKHTDTTHLPLYLYRGNTSKKFKNYIFNFDIFKKSLLLILTLQKTTKELPKYQYWMDKAEPLFVKFNQCSNLDSFKIKNKDIHYTYTNNFPKLDMVITQILKNKNIKFTLFFPPYSRLYYYEMNNEQLNKNISMRRYLLKKLNGSKNVNIFAFDNLFFTNDLFYYKDKAHYRAVINKKILVMISKNIGRLTLKNIDYYEQTFIKNLSNYSIYTSSTECKKYSKKNNLVANILNI